jgi:hypothetical protein
LIILPFNCDHGQKAGVFARTVFEVKKRGIVKFSQRPIIPNDSKLFAQADVEDSIDAYVTADVESSKIYAIIREQCNARFDFIDITTPVNQQFGVLF